MHANLVSAAKSGKFQGKEAKPDFFLLEYEGMTLAKLVHLPDPVEGLDHFHAIRGRIVSFKSPEGLLVDLFLLGQDALLEFYRPVGTRTKGLALVVKAKGISENIGLAVFLLCTV